MSHLRRADIQGYRASDGTFQPLRLDQSCNALVEIGFAHNRLHAGFVFSYYDVVTLGNGASQDYLITTPNTTTWAHFGFKAAFNDGKGTAYLFAGADRNGTTLQSVFNRNRNSLNVNTTTVHKGQSGGTTDGTQFYIETVGQGTADGGEAGTPQEIVLKQNTKYLLRLTNNTAVSNTVSLALDWYEHANLV